MTLTDRQKTFVAAVMLYRRQHGYSPAVRDLMGMVDMQSPNSVKEYYSRLVRKGWLVQEPNKARTVQLSEEAKQRMVI